MKNCKEELLPCVYCGGQPRIIHYDTNMWYVQCHCDKHLQYEFLGCDESIAIERWNYANRIMNRTPPPKNKKVKK